MTGPPKGSSSHPTRSLLQSCLTTDTSGAAAGVACCCAAARTDKAQTKSRRTKALISRVLPGARRLRGGGREMRTGRGPQTPPARQGVRAAVEESRAARTRLEGVAEADDDAAVAAVRGPLVEE